MKKKPNNHSPPASAQTTPASSVPAKRSPESPVAEKVPAFTKSIVIWGTNLTSTVGIKFTRKQLVMVQLAPYQYNVIIGILLSDGWLEFSSKANKNARWGFKQSLDKFAYVWFVFNILSHYCSSSPRLTTSIRAGNRFYGLRFRTRAMPCLTELYSLFYPNGVKIVPYNIFELLTPIALAHMIIGDGSVQSHGLIICTDSYTVQDVVRLINVLMIKYRLDCTVRFHSTTQPRIYISQSSMPSLLNIVSPFMHPSMLYKLKSALSNPSNHKKIEVTDIKNNTTTSYNSIREAARALNCNESSIRKNLKSNSNKPYKKIYMFAYKSRYSYLVPIIPIKIYSNAEDDKAQILSENINKSGIYKWKNRINGKKYIGSAVNLTNRLWFYYSFKAIENVLKRSQSHICSALLKYGHYNFSLTIIEYCEPDKCLERENFYLSCFPHKYNILPKAGSSSGHKHSDETKTKISDALKGENHPNFGKKKHKGSGRASQAIEVFDNKNNQTTTYDSISAAARALNIRNSNINMYFLNNQEKPYKGKYTFKKL